VRLGRVLIWVWQLTLIALFLRLIVSRALPILEAFR